MPRTLSEDWTRDLAIQVMDYVWYGYLGMDDKVQEYDFAVQDTIHTIINKHMSDTEDLPKDKLNLEVL